MSVARKLMWKISRFLWVLAAGALCAACGMNLRPTPVVVSISLSGAWQAPTAQRDAVIEQLRAALKQADEKQIRRERKRGGPGAGPGPGGVPSTGGPGSREKWEVRDERDQEQALLAAVVPPESFNVSQLAGHIDITPNAGARRSFTPGEPSTLVTIFGSFHIESGWQGDEFVVHSRDAQDGIEVVERYRKQMDGTLAIAITFSTKLMKEQQFKLVYRAS
jgi:hypothetical protein